MNTIEATVERLAQTAIRTVDTLEEVTLAVDRLSARVGQLEEARGRIRDPESLFEIDVDCKGRPRPTEGSMTAGRSDKGNAGAATCGDRKSNRMTSNLRFRTLRKGTR